MDERKNQPPVYDIDYSIIICTYNPEERILKRCLQAVYQLDTDNITIEVILVDNNSEVPVKELYYVKEFCEKMATLKTIRVAEQGVVHARIAAINISAGKHIVYFDNDNEPQRDYLQSLKKLHAAFPQVAAWGPGNIEVDFIDGIDRRIEGYASIAFQQRHEEEIHFANNSEWQSCYPFGTGLCIYSFLLKEYVLRAKQGQFTLTGRTGNRLSSGEDTQMIMLCISKGYFAGVAPSLRMTHIIPGTRANYKYLKRLTYGTAVCYQSCLLEVFPERKNLLENAIPSGSKFVRQTLKRLIKAGYPADPNKIFDLVYFIASKVSIYIALHKQAPFLIRRIIKHLNIDE